MTRIPEREADMQIRFFLLAVLLLALWLGVAVWGSIPDGIGLLEDLR